MHRVRKRCYTWFPRAVDASDGIGDSGMELAKE